MNLVYARHPSQNMIKRATFVLTLALLQHSLSATCPADSTQKIKEPIFYTGTHFTYQGTNDQNYNLPLEANAFHVYLWGAGGGSPVAPSRSFGLCGSGGAGGFILAEFLDVTPGSSIAIQVGQKGRRAGAMPSNYAQAELDGGQVCKGSYYYGFQPGGGGASSRIYYPTDGADNPLAVAGAGGGGVCGAGYIDQVRGGYGGVVPEKMWTMSNDRYAVKATNPHPTLCVTPSGGGGYRGGGFFSFTEWLHFYGGGGGSSYVNPTREWFLDETDYSKSGLSQGEMYKTILATPSNVGDKDQDGYVVIQPANIVRPTCACNTLGHLLNPAGTACVPCASGYYCPTHTHPNTQDACPTGQTSDPGAFQPSGCYCLPGTYNIGVPCYPCQTEKHCPGNSIN